MIPYSQKDPRWKKLKLGTTDLTMGDFGCFVTSIASIDGRTPDVVLSVLNNNRAFDLEGQLFSNVAAESLGLDYEGMTTNNPKTLCIAETDFYKKLRVPQHFFVFLGNGQIMDPIDGKIKMNPYKIITYRLFKKREQVQPVIVKISVEKKINWVERIVLFIRDVLSRFFAS